MKIDSNGIQINVRETGDIPGVGHLSTLEQPNTFANEILTFVSAIERHVRG